MPSQTRQPTNTTTTTPTATTTVPQTQPQGESNAGMAALLNGTERLDGDAASYFARGIVFQKGMKGELIKRVQLAIGSGQDGGFGSITEAKLKLFQKANGLAETGTVDALTWAAIAAKTATLANLSGEEDFARMWENHPKNYQDDYSQNVDSEALVAQLGMAPGSVPNTCALRMSTMMNRMGGNLGLDETKGRQAGLHQMRAGGLYMPSVKDPESESNKDKVILSAKEMWTYIEKHRGKPDVTWPPRGRFKTQEEADKGAAEVEAMVAGKKGFVAFDKIFGYGGSGHIDLFDGPQLADSSSWYPSECIKLWYVVK